MDLGASPTACFPMDSRLAGSRATEAVKTIAIVDAYDDPNAAADLNTFSTYFGLPDFGGAGEPTFQKIEQSGTPPSGSSSWSIEESIDIEWAHAMAPMANIVLYETSDASDSLYAGVQTAAGLPGVDAVSRRCSGPEFDGETDYDSYFVTPAGHVGGANPLSGISSPGGVTFLAATGDYEAYVKNSSMLTPQYPAKNFAERGCRGGNDSQCPEEAVQITLGRAKDGLGKRGQQRQQGCAERRHQQRYESEPTYQKGVVASLHNENATSLSGRLRRCQPQHQCPHLRVPTTSAARTLGPNMAAPVLHVPCWRE